MKPILLITETIQDIIKTQKGISFKSIKDLPIGTYDIEYDEEEKCFIALWSNDLINGYSKLKEPFKEGEKLYVRETWTVEDVFEENEKYYACIGYKAEEDTSTGHQTKITIDKYDLNKYNYNLYYGNEFMPSIYMPKAAARLFLEVTRIIAEKQQANIWTWKIELKKI